MSTDGGMSIGGISASVSLESGNLDSQLGAIQGRLDKVAEGIRRWQAQLNAGKITAQQFDAAINPLIAEQDALRASMDRVTQAMAAQATATTQVSTAMKTVSTGAAQVGLAGRNSAMGLLMLGQAVDDLQYGFRAIVNNIPGVVMGLGGSAGIAGAVAIAGVGINQLINHWDDLKAALTENTIETEADRMERLASATGRTADETKRLNEEIEKRRQKDVDRMMGGEPQERRATEAAVQAVFNEAEPETVRSFLAAQLERRDLTEAEQHEIREAGRKAMAEGSGGELGESMGTAEELEGKRRTAEQAARLEIGRRMQAEARRAAENLMLVAGREDASGREARAQIEGFARNPAGPFPAPRALRNLTEAGPEERRAMEEGARRSAEDIEMREQMRRQAREQDEERSRLADEAFDESVKHVGDAGRARVEARHQSRLREAEEAFPGIGAVAQTAMRTALARDIPMDAVREQMASFLAGAGVEKGRAGTLAGELARDKDAREIERQAVQEHLRPTRSQVFDAADIAARIQSGVGGEEIPKKSLAVLEAIRSGLDDIKDKAGLNPTVKK